MQYKEEIKQEVIKLRLNNKFSVNKIADITGIPRRTICYWVKPYPLNNSDKRKSYREAWSKLAYSDPLESELSKSSNGDPWKIAEARFILKSTSLGYNLYKPLFDNEPGFDYLLNCNLNFYRIQIRVIKRPKTGKPICKTTKRDKNSSLCSKRSPLTITDCDFLVGYYLHSDKCYVWHVSELPKNCVTITQNAEEAWSKISNNSYNIHSTNI